MIINKFAPSVFTANFKAPITKGLDYRLVESLIKPDISRAAIISASNSDELTSDMIEQMILRRLPKTIKQAELFANEHPNLVKEDVIQETILGMVKMAKEYKGQSNGDFNQHAFYGERRILEGLLKQNELDIKHIDSSVDLKQIKDESLETIIDNKILKEQLEIAMSDIKPRLSYVIDRRFGLSDNQPETLKEVGRQLNISPEQVRRLEAKGLGKLKRHPSKNDLFKGFY